MTIILFLARGVIAGLFQAAYVYTPEVYPTALRSGKKLKQLLRKRVNLLGMKGAIFAIYTDYL